MNPEHPCTACPECDDCPNSRCKLCEGTDEYCPICECPYDDCEYWQSDGDDFDEEDCE